MICRGFWSRRVVAAVVVVSILVVQLFLGVSQAIASPSAGLSWGPVYVGNLKLYLTNPHVGYAGPKFPYAEHVNFRVDRKVNSWSYTPVANYHITKYG